MTVDRNAHIIGETAARLMDKVDDDVESGALGDDARVVNVMVVVEVDHVKPGDDHSDGNLQGICDPCHASKSGREGNAARGQR